MKLQKSFVIFVGILFIASVCVLVSFFPGWKEESKDSFPPENKNQMQRIDVHPVFDKSLVSTSTTMKKQLIDVGGTKIHVVSIGTASQLPVLLLHGQAFSSADWERIHTLEELNKAGFYAIAIDLPSYGHSQAMSAGITVSNFLENLIQVLDIDKLVIVSPSMSGMFSLPFLMENSDKLSGFVPISPVINSKIKEKDFKECKVPTLIVYGENDGGAVKRNEQLSALPNRKFEMIPNGGHPCYLDDPVRFHQLLIKFLKGLLK